MFKFVVSFVAALVIASSASAGEYKLAENSQYFGNKPQVFKAYNGVKTKTYQTNSAELRAVLCTAMKAKFKNPSCGGSMKLVQCNGAFTMGWLGSTGFPTLCVSRFDGQTVYVNAAKKWFDLASERFID